MRNSKNKNRVGIDEDMIMLSLQKVAYKSFLVNLKLDAGRQDKKKNDNCIFQLQGKERQRKKAKMSARNQKIIEK